MKLPYSSQEENNLHSGNENYIPKENYIPRDNRIFKDTHSLGREYNALEVDEVDTRYTVQKEETVRVEKLDTEKIEQVTEETVKSTSIVTNTITAAGVTVAAIGGVIILNKVVEAPKNISFDAVEVAPTSISYNLLIYEDENTSDTPDPDSTTGGDPETETVVETKWEIDCYLLEDGKKMEGQKSESITQAGTYRGQFTDISFNSTSNYTLAVYENQFLSLDSKPILTYEIITPTTVTFSDINASQEGLSASINIAGSPKTKQLPRRGDDIDLPRPCIPVRVDFLENGDISDSIYITTTGTNSLQFPIEEYDELGSYQLVAYVGNSETPASNRVLPLPVWNVDLDNVKVLNGNTSVGFDVRAFDDEMDLMEGEGHNGALCRPITVSLLELTEEMEQDLEQATVVKTTEVSHLGVTSLMFNDITFDYSKQYILAAFVDGDIYYTHELEVVNPNAPIRPAYIGFDAPEMTTSYVSAIIHAYTSAEDLEEGQGNNGKPCNVSIQLVEGGETVIATVTVTRIGIVPIEFTNLSLDEEKTYELWAYVENDEEPNNFCTLQFPPIAISNVVIADAYIEDTAYLTLNIFNTQEDLEEGQGDNGKRCPEISVDLLKDGVVMDTVYVSTIGSHELSFISFEMDESSTYTLEAHIGGSVDVVDSWILHQGQQQGLSVNNARFGNASINAANASIIFTIDIYNEPVDLTPGSGDNGATCETITIQLLENSTTIDTLTVDTIGSHELTFSNVRVDATATYDLLAYIGSSQSPADTYTVQQGQAQPQPLTVSYATFNNVNVDDSTGIISYDISVYNTQTDLVTGSGDNGETCETITIQLLDHNTLVDTDTVSTIGIHTMYFTNLTIDSNSDFELVSYIGDSQSTADMYTIPPVQTGPITPDFVQFANVSADPGGTLEFTLNIYSTQDDLTPGSGNNGEECDEITISFMEDDLGLDGTTKNTIGAHTIEFNNINWDNTKTYMLLAYMNGDLVDSYTVSEAQSGSPSFSGLGLVATRTENADTANGSTIYTYIPSYSVEPDYTDPNGYWSDFELTFEQNQEPVIEDYSITTGQPFEITDMMIEPGYTTDWTLTCLSSNPDDMQQSPTSPRITVSNGSFTPIAYVGGFNSEQTTTTVYYFDLYDPTEQLSNITVSWTNSRTGTTSTYTDGDGISVDYINGRITITDGDFNGIALCSAITVTATSNNPLDGNGTVTLYRYVSQ